jgi:hypothetical protein
MLPVTGAEILQALVGATIFGSIATRILRPNLGAVNLRAHATQTGSKQGLTTPASPDMWRAKRISGMNVVRRRRARPATLAHEPARGGEGATV